MIFENSTKVRMTQFNISVAVNTAGMIINFFQRTFDLLTIRSKW